MKTYFLFICAICCYLTGNAHSTEYNIFQFGASKDTSVVQTQAINAAIENCYRQGGGKVIIPSGIYKSGTIILKDNVELHLESGAYLYASDNYDDFPVQPQASYRSQKDAGGWVSLIYAVDAKKHQYYRKRYDRRKRKRTKRAYQRIGRRPQRTAS